jgi:hypothetical protein
MTFSRIAFAAVLLSFPSIAFADPVNVAVELTPTDSIKMDFADGSKHFVLMVRREGTAHGSGLLDGATVVEYGWHDITPGQGGHPLGYLELKNSNGDIAYLKWHVRGVSMGGALKGPPVVHGIWELTSGTGVYAEMRGLGTMTIGPVTTMNDPERKFTLVGDLGQKP